MCVCDSCSPWPRSLAAPPLTLAPSRPPLPPLPPPPPQTVVRRAVRAPSVGGEEVKGRRKGGEAAGRYMGGKVQISRISQISQSAQSAQSAPSWAARGRRGGGGGEGEAALPSALAALWRGAGASLRCHAARKSPRRSRRGRASLVATSRPAAPPRRAPSRPVSASSPPPPGSAPPPCGPAPSPVGLHGIPHVCRAPPGSQTRPPLSPECRKEEAAIS